MVGGSERDELTAISRQLLKRPLSWEEILEEGRRCGEFLNKRRED